MEGASSSSAAGSSSVGSSAAFAIIFSSSFATRSSTSFFARSSTVSCLSLLPNALEKKDAGSSGAATGGAFFAPVPKKESFDGGAASSGAAGASFFEPPPKKESFDGGASSAAPTSRGSSHQGLRTAVRRICRGDHVTS